MVTCTKLFNNLPFAHRQHTHDGHCALVHGHNFSFELTFASDTPDQNGFVFDFGKMGLIKEFFAQQFDHTLLLSEDDPELPFFREAHNKNLCKLVVAPAVSAEGLALYVYVSINALLTICEEQGNPRGVRLVKVTCFEDTKNSATYIP